jgi:hypothetical protein
MGTASTGARLEFDFSIANSLYQFVDAAIVRSAAFEIFEVLWGLFLVPEAQVCHANAVNSVNDTKGSGFFKVRQSLFRLARAFQFPHCLFIGTKHGWLSHLR